MLIHILPNDIEKINFVQAPVRNFCTVSIDANFQCQYSLQKGNHSWWKHVISMNIDLWVQCTLNSVCDHFKWLVDKWLGLSVKVRVKVRARDDSFLFESVQFVNPAINRNATCTLVWHLTSLPRSRIVVVDSGVYFRVILENVPTLFAKSLPRLHAYSCRGYYMWEDGWVGGYVFGWNTWKYLF